LGFPLQPSSLLRTILNNRTKERAPEGAPTFG
jgi:hypothetical protein